MVRRRYGDLSERMKETKRRLARKHAKTEKGKISHRRARLKWKYGITPEDYDRMLVEQGGTCALCDRDRVNNRRLAIDHCHETGKIRGILCDIHNRALGNLGDNEEALMRVLNYLRGIKNEDTKIGSKAKLFENPPLARRG